MINFLKIVREYGKRIEGLMQKNFDSKPFHGNDDNKHIRTKIKTFKDSIITSFLNKST